MNQPMLPEARQARIEDRQHRAKALCEAIAACHPRDAATVMTAALQGAETDGPQHDLFGTMRRDAEWWAEIAPPHEVQAYVVAGLRQVGQSAIGPKARKDIFAALWQGMAPGDKAAFLRAVGGAP